MKKQRKVYENKNTYVDITHAETFSPVFKHVSGFLSRLLHSKNARFSFLQSLPIISLAAYNCEDVTGVNAGLYAILF